MKEQTPDELGLNDAERFVAAHCERSFLSLWTWANPQGKKGKELCDLLVVCDPDVIVVSVKRIAFKDTGNPTVDLGRWQKRAVDASVKQVFKAERWLGLEGVGERITGKSGESGLLLPDHESRRLHRVAVALGVENKVSLCSRPFDDKGRDKYVHVFDGISFGIAIQELDTITDFVGYLRAKEVLSGQVMMEGEEEDLLALYLQYGRKFPDKDLIVVGEGRWESFSRSEALAARKQADQISYVWDQLIRRFCEDQRDGVLLGEQDINGVEQALRTMARENRFTRRGLGKSFRGFLDANQERRSHARIHRDPGLATYVFLGCRLGTTREDRITELKARCLIARWLHPTKVEVVGIATEIPKSGQGFSLDLFSLRILELSPEQVALAKQWQEEFGYFKHMRFQCEHEEEYPPS